MCSTSSPGPNCFPVFVWFVFLGTFSSHSVQNLPPGSLWLVMTNSFSRMQQKQSLVFFFSPFPLRIDACVHSLIRMYWFHSLGQKWEVGASMAKKNFADTQKVHGQIQMILRWFWQPPLTEIYYPGCVLKQKAKHIHNAGIPKNKN